jgi:hypothetical protein
VSKSNATVVKLSVLAELALVKAFRFLKIKHHLKLKKWDILLNINQIKSNFVKAKQKSAWK